MESENLQHLALSTSQELKLVKKQLNLILSSRYFNSAKKMARFLEYIVAETINGNQRTIKQYSIGIEVFGFDPDFDPDQNAVVRITGCRVRKRLDSYYQNEGGDDSLIIKIPKGSYIPEFSFAKESPQEDISYTTKSCGPKIALICFSDKTQSIESNRLLYQITDSMAINLSRSIFSRLVVCNPFSDRSQSSNIETEIKSRHHAHYTLALYLQEHAKKQYELIYRLMDTDTNEIIWSEKYTIFSDSIKEKNAVLNKISTMILDHKQGLVLSHWTRKLLANKTTIPEKYQCAVYYRSISYGEGKDEIKHLSNICRRALHRNPEDVLASVILARCCQLDYVSEHGIFEFPLEIGKRYAENALRLKPSASETHYALGQILFCMKQWERATYEFEKAAALYSTRAGITYGCGFYLCMMEKWEDGMALVNKAIQISPLVNSHFYFAPFAFYFKQKKYDLALVEAIKMDDPQLLHGLISRCAAYSKLGEYEKAQRELREILIRSPHFLENGKVILKRYLGTKALSKSLWKQILITHKSIQSSNLNNFDQDDISWEEVSDFV